jgi:hypothetical protein
MDKFLDIVSDKILFSENIKSSMSNQKYKFSNRNKSSSPDENFSEDISKLISHIENDFNVLISESFCPEGIKIDGEILNLKDISKDLKNLNQSGELKETKEIENLLDFTMNFPEIMKSMSQVIKNMNPKS